MLKLRSVKEMKKIFVVFVLALLIAILYGASFSVLGPKGGGGKKPPADETPANPEIAYTAFSDNIMNL
jgi:hypothetical protein